MKNFTAFLIPLDGLVIRDPVTKLIMLPTGEVKPLIGKEGRYWKRRISDGSVKILEEKKVQPIIRRKQTKGEDD